MNTKRFLLSCFGVYVVYQILSFLINGIWLGDTYASLAEVWRPEAELMSKLWILFVTSAVWAVFFCYIFVRGHEDKGIMEGVRYGLIIGLFFSIPQAYEQYAIYPIPYSLALKWMLSGVLICVLCGATAALIYKPAEAQPAEAAS